MLAEDEGSVGSGGNCRRVLLLRQPARVHHRIGLDQVDLGSADHRHFQSDGPQQGIVEGYAAGAVVADGVGPGADRGEYTRALGKIVGRAGDEFVAVGGKHAGFAVGNYVVGVAEIKALDLVDVLPVEAGIGKISLGNESGDAATVRSTTRRKQKRNQAQAQICNFS